jgi:hypothetical protein
MGLEDCQFIYNGQVLGDSMTFRSYRIKEKDTLVVVPGGPSGTEADRWLSLTQDEEGFHEKVQFILREDTAREAARIRDVLMTKMERKPRPFRRLCTAVMAMPLPTVAGKKIDLNIDYAQLEEPSIDPLPIFWPSTTKDLSTVDSFSQSADILAVKQDQTESIVASIRP